MADIPAGGGVKALLGPTNTGKTHRAVERMLTHASGMIGLPLRLLAREVYDRVTARVGENAVALVTGEEKRVPRRPRYWVCTVESMPVRREVDFLAVDEIQLVAHRQRGHTFTERLLHARGRVETWFSGADTMRSLVRQLLPTAEIHRHPRFSSLTHSGTHSLGSLPARTAVVAFSVRDVYELAERLRQRHGGTAVVLGALSPRTRNAQVAMYQAGEVQHLVATDAIGMGLNMDVDRVVFASLRKFDGKEIRPLESAELAQIAGRAGRYTRDGTFGTLRPVPGIDPRVVTSIEHHEFPQIHRAVWRNCDLEFSSLETLIGALRARPPRKCLQLVERSDDFEALVQLSRDEEVRRRADGPESIELLWDVCRIPDFRKLLLDSHVQLLAAIYGQLGRSGRIDEDWMAKRIMRLDDADGDIETLMNRIAFIRTWTYITNHGRWVSDAEHWRGITREIEDRQSDALHRRLTERFVERPSSGPIRPTQGRRSRRRHSGGERTTVDPDHPFRALLELELPDAPRASKPASDEHRVQALVDAPFESFGVDEHGNVRFEGHPIARFARGPDVLHPQVSLLPRMGSVPLGAGAHARVTRRLVAWSRDAVAGLLAPLSELDANALRPAARGLVYQLERGLGTVDGQEAAEQVCSLQDGDRARLAEAGLVIGHGSVYLPETLRPSSVRLRAALCSAQLEPRRPPPVPSPGAVSVKVTGDVHPSFYPNIGFVVRGPLAVRADQLERAHAWLSIHAGSGSPIPHAMNTWLGCRRGQLRRVLEAMGYRIDDEGRAAPRRRTRRGRRRNDERRGSGSPRTRGRGGVGSRR